MQLSCLQRSGEKCDNSSTGKTSCHSTKPEDRYGRKTPQNIRILTGLADKFVDEINDYHGELSPAVLETLKNLCTKQANKEILEAMLSEIKEED